MDIGYGIAFVLGGFVGVAAVLVYASLIAARRSDEWIEDYRARLEDDRARDDR